MFDKSRSILMVGAPWDIMTLIHLANLPRKRVPCYALPFAGSEGDDLALHGGVRRHEWLEARSEPSA